MSRPRPPLSPEVRALLDREREIPPLPATVRARALARARAALAAGGATRRAAPPPASRGRWAAVAALVCLAGLAVSAGAYQLRSRFMARPPAFSVAVVATPPAPVAAAPVIETPVVRPSVVEAAVINTASRPVAAPNAPNLSPSDAARAELRLLRQARAAVVRGDYAEALAPIAEHARRFKDGRLAEEREALRVKSLAGLGRTEDAHRAADAFRAQFPRSVLLPVVSQMPAAKP